MFLVSFLFDYEPKLNFKTSSKRLWTINENRLNNKFLFIDGETVEKGTPLLFFPIVAEMNEKINSIIIIFSTKRAQLYAF